MAMQTSTIWPSIMIVTCNVSVQTTAFIPPIVVYVVHTAPDDKMDASKLNPVTVHKYNNNNDNNNNNNNNI